jgi:hypothetical protein
MHRSLPCEKSAEIHSKVTCCPWNDTNGHNYDEPGTEVFRNNRFVSRVGLNLISQHIKLRGLLQTYTWERGHFQAKFHLQYKIYSTVHKATSRQISYDLFYTMLTNDSRPKTLIRVTINFTYLTFYIHMGTRSHFS